MLKTKTTYTYSAIWKVAYPIFLTLLVQNLIQVIGTAFLGRVGEVELGASALAGIYYIVVFMIAFGFSTGSQILIGRRNGEKNYSHIGEIVVGGILFLLVVALSLFSVTRTFSGAILSKILNSQNVLHAAIEYLDIRIFGIFFASVNVMFRAFYVGTTRTKVLSANALIMAGTTIFFDYVLIFGKWGFPEMGIAGAALSAVFSEIASVIFFFIYTGCRVDMEKYGFKTFSLRKLSVIGRILNISLSLMLQYFLSLGSWFFFFLAIEHLGETPLAISNIVRSLYMLISIPVFALAATANTLVSNSIGAGKTDEVMSLVWKISKFAILICLAFMVVSFMFPRLELSVYTADAGLIEAAVPSLYMILMVLPLIALSNIFFSAISGTGNTRTALLLEIGTLIIYIFYIWLSIIHLRVPLYITWTCEYVYGALIFLFSFIYMKRGGWRNKVI